MINGENGLSQKAEGKGRASYYVSFPLLSVTGKITPPMVRTRSLEKPGWIMNGSPNNWREQIGWDWFSVQLDNNTELMLFELRRQDGA